MNLLKKALKAREATSALFLVALFVIVSLLNPSLASSENIAAVFNSAVVYILIAVGMAFACSARRHVYLLRRRLGGKSTQSV